MVEIAPRFDDATAYDRFIGRCGQAAGAVFLDWIAPPSGVRWLDVGCGTGLFTELILDRCAPCEVVAVDAAQAQIDHARRKPLARQVDFRIADAQALPFPAATFDVVASALAINFIPDRSRALSEMRRVARPGGIVAGYVWDFAAERSPSGPFRLGMREVVSDVPALPGTADSSLEALRALFAHAGFNRSLAISIEVTVSFPDFETFWAAQTPSYAPTTRMLAAMTESERMNVIDAVQARLPAQPDGRIDYRACANAVKAQVPDRSTSIEDAGKAIHPLQVEGRYRGGAVQGIGWALNE
jgi:ubiquinone/menaquinone biosynthesis C-methylase UbiE